MQYYFVRVFVFIRGHLGCLGFICNSEGEMMKVLSSPGLSALSCLTYLKPRMRIQFIFSSLYDYLYLSLVSC